MSEPQRMPVAGFRLRVLLAMMFVVVVVTSLALYFVQRNVQAAVVLSAHDEFQSRLSFLLGREDARQVAVAERCRNLARSSRIRAALEEDSIDDLYLNGRIELRDILGDVGIEGSKTAVNPSKVMRASFFRFLNAEGKVLPPPGSDGTELTPWEKQVAAAGIGPGTQQTGYIPMKTVAGTELPGEVVITPIIGPDGGLMGALLLGFPPIDFGAEGQGQKIQNGIWLAPRLYLPELSEPDRLALSAEITQAIAQPDRENIVQVRGEPHLLFQKKLNPGSVLAPAYQISLYSLAESEARQRQWRWKILGSALLILLGGLAASHFFSAGLARPVEELAAHSAKERIRSAEELLGVNAELEKALADLQATQQQVIQQERLRALGQMASGIAHDFNNALMPIMGYTELLIGVPAILENREKATSYLEIIRTGANDAASVVARLREFYRSNETGDVLASVDLKHLAGQIVALTRPKWKDQAQSHGVEIQILTELDDVPPIAGDAAALREVLTNLVFNAVDAMPRGGTITLRTHYAGDRAIIEVADSGTGMSEDVRARCLEPFFSTKGERGTGLGLSMVFGIVQRHHGLIDIRSQLGEGTTFMVSFPIQTTDSVGEKVQVAEEKKQRPLHILVVEDEPQIREILSILLEEEGHTVATAENGLEGLQRFRAGTFDLVITDKAMPGMSGDQMAVAIKQLSPHVPIVLLSGFNSLRNEHLPGVDVVAEKPITLSALHTAVRQAMELPPFPL